MIVEKKVNMQLVGMDANAFSLLGHFQRAARKSGWSAEEIEVVMDDARSGDYNHLLCVLMEHTKESNHSSPAATPTRRSVSASSPSARTCPIAKT